MSLPPMTMWLRTRGEGMPSLRLWLPLFLIWPLLLLVVLLFSPFLLAGILVLSVVYHARWDWPQLLAEFYAVLCGLRGLEVDMEEPRRGFAVQIRFH